MTDELRVAEVVGVIEELPVMVMLGVTDGLWVIEGVQEPLEL